jgi:hypothetical protein
MAAVDAATKEMEALHVGQNDEIKVSNCSSSFVFYAHRMNHLSRFYKKGVHFLWHLFENRGIILFTELVLFLS